MDFYLGWTSYQNGFGDPSGNFWLGLDKIHILTYYYTTLKIVMEFEGNEYVADYSVFSVGDSMSDYIMYNSGFSSPSSPSSGESYYLFS